MDIKELSEGRLSYYYMEIQVLIETYMDQAEKVIEPILYRSACQ